MIENINVQGPGKEVTDMAEATGGAVHTENVAGIGAQPGALPGRSLP